MADAVSRLPTVNKDKEEPRTEVQRRNEMFTNNEANELLTENVHPSVNSIRLH